LRLRLTRPTALRPPEHSPENCHERMLCVGDDRVRDVSRDWVRAFRRCGEAAVAAEWAVCGGRGGPLWELVAIPDSSRFHALNGNSNSRFGDRAGLVNILIYWQILDRYGANRRNFPGYFPVRRELCRGNRAQREFRRCGAARSPRPPRPAAPGHQVSAVPFSPTPPFFSITPKSCNRHGQAGLQPSPVPPNRSAPSRGS
jgi:hypothetical protein